MCVLRGCSSVDVWKRGVFPVKTISFVVKGDPIGQGSMKHIGGGRMIASNDKTLKAWRSDVALACQVERNRIGGLVQFTGAVRLDVKFCVTRSKAAEKRKHPVTPYDLDKLCRSIGDGISVNCDLLVNDAQIVELNAMKVFADGCPYGVHVTVTEL